MNWKNPRSEIRTNALWGSGSGGGSRNNALWGRGGRRANALWGRGGRGLVLAGVAALTIVVPLGASAGSKSPQPASFVAPELLAAAKSSPNTILHVIVQSSGTSNGVSNATAAFNDAEQQSGNGNHDGQGNYQGGERVRRQLNLVDGVALTIKARRLLWLAKRPGLTITSDAPMKLSGSILSSTQMWPYASGNAKLWGSPFKPAPATGTIAIVDSGIDANRADFDNGARVLPQVTITTRTPNSPGDGRGHGTFVASVAAGSAPGHAGAAPNAKILPIDVMDDTGTALTSDVIAACSYILQNKDALNIKVANFSLHSGARNHFYNDPLDRAVEKLWFNGIFVVAAAGNYGVPTGPSGVLYAPGNDPFVMTVGAADIGTSILTTDDTIAPWSAWGYTEDGFSKPELSAPGRFIVGAVPTSATLTSERPDHVVAPGYMELSGTSFAAPVVAGTAAQIMARHPSWTPDQIKGALMVTARPVPHAVPGSAGVGELNAARAALYPGTTPNPNLGVRGFLVTDPATGALTFNAASWNAAVKANASWSAASWGDASWGDASWSTASWGDLSFSAASWGDVSWADASWADASWADMSAEDAAEGDASGPAPQMDAATSAQLQADPDLALPPDQVAADPNVTAPAAPPAAPAPSVP